MSLPPSLRVRLSSEAAAAITLTPVVVQEMATRELMGHMLGVTGKSVERIHEILQGGSLVSGGSRFRWEGFAADPAAIEEMLASFPDPDPARRFSVEQCTRVVLRGQTAHIEIPRQAADKRKFLRRTSYWDVLTGVLRTGAPAYLDYSYKERVDRYRLPLTLAQAAAVRDGAARLVYSTLVRQISFAAIDAIEAHVPRQ